MALIALCEGKTQHIESFVVFILRFSGHQPLEEDVYKQLQRWMMMMLLHIGTTNTTMGKQYVFVNGYHV